jgi:hypothetical protein
VSGPILSGDGAEVRITQPSPSFHEAIVTHLTAKANGPRARGAAMIYDHGRAGQRVVREALRLLRFSNAQIAAQNGTSWQGT